MAFELNSVVRIDLLEDQVKSALTVLAIHSCNGLLMFIKGKPENMRYWEQFFMPEAV